METLIILLLLIFIGLITVMRGVYILIKRFKRRLSPTSNNSEEDILYNEIQRAIKEQEFVLHYQPLYSLTSNKVEGVEALVRWEHPTKGMISPIDFIPLAEETGLIIPLGDWILKESCRQHKEWGVEDLKVSVNLSANQFIREGLSERVKEIIKEEGMNPKNLVLEITETTSMSDIKYTQKALQDLIDVGISVSLDDFGTGHSSLSYLKNFPITTLKIDRTFIWDIAKDKNGETLIKTIINMARDLDLRVIAEGVEVKEQLTFLKDLACDYIQGYLLSPPVPSDKFITKLNNGELVLEYK